MFIQWILLSNTIKGSSTKSQTIITDVNCVNGIRFPSRFLIKEKHVLAEGYHNGGKDIEIWLFGKIDIF